jgi:hypothetical protein
LRWTLLLPLLLQLQARSLNPAPLPRTVLIWQALLFPLPSVLRFLLQPPSLHLLVPAACALQGMRALPARACGNPALLQLLLEESGHPSRSHADTPAAAAAAAAAAAVERVCLHAVRHTTCPQQALPPLQLCELADL